MRFYKHLKENFYKYINTGNYTPETPMFVNPTNKELNELVDGKVGEIRFIADGNAKKLYVAKSYDTTHQMMAKLINFSKTGGYKILQGFGIKVGNKWSVKHLLYNTHDLDDFDWINKYMDLSSYIGKRKMRLKSYLDEDFLKYGKAGWKETPIYINPTARDIKDFVKETGYRNVRFIADAMSRKIYMADASEMIHNTLWLEVRMDKRDVEHETLFSGEGEIKGSKIIITRSDILEWMWEDGKISKDGLDKYYLRFKWVEKYINGFRKYLLSLMETGR